MKRSFAVLASTGLLALLAWQAQSQETQDAASTSLDEAAVATFAGGCFWCVEEGFEKIPGVLEAVSGYTGGDEAQPTYEEVSSGQTGHTEAVQVYYDPQVITYEGLVEGFWRFMDPTDNQGQFVDRGRQYRPGIFYHSSQQQRVAEASLQALKNSDRYDEPLVIEIEAFERFYRAEDYHQDYYRKNPLRYKFYTHNSGRYQFIEEVWGDDQQLDFSRFHPEADSAAVQGPPGPNYQKPSDQVLRQRLSDEEFEVTQEEGTERPFENAYWDEKRPGLYVDIVSGEPLFSSRDKYRSGTGWPSFTRPISPSVVVEREDRSWLSVRTEIRSRLADSHLGHVFEDGPQPTGLRYCMNSAAMEFIPLQAMRERGYADFIPAVTGESDN
ncbi:peptide-methionine (S)-S-oxide reductase MsrA [Marinospirillum perlucidum]|uniref:peptide-methionine (S)-S-oxide reductase MsrA n=1 Tax=Marinospirillum perlucidum TaxID=1982602 RepID=UPI000DF3A4C4|nr:peptide-methionine (S)-S-oxide reductase MsrA [Marinospirillum perlucidum]